MSPPALPVIYKTARHAIRPVRVLRSYPRCALQISPLLVVKRHRTNTATPRPPPRSRSTPRAMHPFPPMPATLDPRAYHEMAWAHTGALSRPHSTRTARSASSRHSPAGSRNGSMGSYDDFGIRTRRRTASSAHGGSLLSHSSTRCVVESIQSGVYIIS